MEDILKSGFFEARMEDVEKAIAKKGSKKRRPMNPFYNGTGDDTTSGLAAGESPEQGSDGEEREFQKLYEELEAGTAEPQSNFEKIYDELAVTATSGSYLPPEIYQLHTDSHSQRMGILTKYTEPTTRTNYNSMASLDARAADPAYDLWSRPEEARPSSGTEEWAATASVDFQGPSLVKVDSSSLFLVGHFFLVQTFDSRFPLD